MGQDAFYSFRLKRLRLLCGLGLVLVAAAVVTWPADSLGTPGSWAARHLGAHGNSVLVMGIGVLTAVLSGVYLVRMRRRGPGSAGG